MIKIINDSDLDGFEVEELDTLSENETEEQEIETAVHTEEETVPT